MNKLTIHCNDAFSIDITVRESDKYTEAVYLKLERHYIPEDIHGTNELFLTTEQLEKLGDFFIEKSMEIKEIQKERHSK